MIMNDGACVVVEVEKKVKFMKWKKCEPMLCICCWFHPFRFKEEEDIFFWIDYNFFHAISILNI